MDEQNKKAKKLYQRWWIWVIGLIAAVLVWVYGGSAIDKARTKQIPNVMGINYTEAETVLKGRGFKVTSVETDAESILSNDNYTKTLGRSVKKGEVFKINNETNPDYRETTKDKNVTIYYAKNDYTYEKPKEENTNSTTNNVAVNNTTTSASTGSDWQQFLKEYEAWADEYVAFLKKYKDNPSNPSFISEYTKLIGETSEWLEKSKKYEDSLKDLSTNDLSEYMKTITRISEKMSSIGK